MPTSLKASIPAYAFNRGLLPPEARRVGTEQFREAVREFYTEIFHCVGGTTRVSFEDERIHVSWEQGAGSEDPLEYAVRLLQQGELDRGISLMQLLLAAEPNHPDILYNLGMAYSDMGRVQDAITLLSPLTVAEPANANGLVALGVAYQRNGDYSEALAALRKAIEGDPKNSYARRNLGGIIASLGGFDEGEPHLREAVRLAPEDQQALYGLAAILEKLGGDNRLQEADELYKKIIDVDPSSYVAEKAREARSRMAHTSFREAVGGEERHDATMYCLDALRETLPYARNVYQSEAGAAYMSGHKAGSRYAWERAGMDGHPLGWEPLEDDEEYDEDDFDPAADKALEALEIRLKEVDIMPELLSRLEQKVTKEAWTIWEAFASFTREELELEPEKVVKVLFTPAWAGSRISRGAKRSSVLRPVRTGWGLERHSLRLGTVTSSV